MYKLFGKFTQSSFCMFRDQFHVEASVYMLICTTYVEKSSRLCLALAFRHLRGDGQFTSHLIYSLICRFISYPILTYHSSIYNVELVKYAIYFMEFSQSRYIQGQFTNMHISVDQHTCKDHGIYIILLDGIFHCLTITFSKPYLCYVYS